MNKLKKGVYDFSIRRIRAKMTMRPTENLTMVLQMGPSNVNVNSKTNTYMDLLDAYAEYKFSDYICHMGAPLDRLVSFFNGSDGYFVI